MAFILIHFRKFLLCRVTKGLGYLMPGQLTAIVSKMMGGFLPAPPPATTDGATLYSQNCASCHGALASSTKAGRTAAQMCPLLLLHGRPRLRQVRKRIRSSGGR